MFFWDQHKTITSCYEKVTGSVCEKYQLTHMEYDPQDQSQKRKEKFKINIRLRSLRSVSRRNPTCPLL